MLALIVIPIAAAIAVKYKRRFEETVFPAIFLIVATMIPVGIFDALVLSLYVTLIYVILAGVLLVKYRKNILKYVFTPGFFGGCTIFVFLAIYSYGRFLNPDIMLSKYGLAILSLRQTDSLRDQCLYYNLNNPFPIVGLWIYFCTRWNVEGFSEWITIFAFDIFIVSGFLPLFCYIKSIRKEFLQWILLLCMIVLMPMLKLSDAYSGLDMAVPQTAAMVYTIIVLYRIICGAYRKGDTLFASFGLLCSCILTKYGAVVSLPIIIGCFAVAIMNATRRKKLISIVVYGGGIVFIIELYNLVYQQISIKEFVRFPAAFLGGFIISIIVVGILKSYQKGNKAFSICAITIIFMAILSVIGLILKNGEYKEYAMDEIIEYTRKLFVCADYDEEKKYIIGKNVIRIYDVPFLLVMMYISRWAYKMQKKESIKKMASVQAFHIAYGIGVMLYLIVFSVIFVSEIRSPQDYSVLSIAPYIAPIIVLSSILVFIQAVRAWGEKKVIVAGTVLLVFCVYSDPIGAVFLKPEEENEYQVISTYKEQRIVELNGNDRVFYIEKSRMNPDAPERFLWTVFPAGVGSVCGLYFNPEPYKWSGGSIPETMTKEELADLIIRGNYTYVYLSEIDDFFIETYYPLFSDYGVDMKNDALYRVEKDENGNLQMKYVVCNR